jgi:hypothetical protein
MRRILIILGIIIVAWAAVYFFYIKPREKVSTPVPNILKPFFPSSTSNNTGSFGSDNTIPSIPGTGIGSQTVSPFKQLTGQPVAGLTIFSLNNTVSVPSTDPKVKPTVQTVTDHYLRYVSRANGYVYEIKNGGVPLQISNVFIPNIYEAYFADNNNTAILRFLRNDNETIATYSVPIPPLNSDGTRTQLSGTYLPDNISALAVSPDQTTVARVMSGQNSTTVSTSASSGTGIKTLLSSPFSEWLPSWAGKTVYVQTKAASVADGFFYSIDQSTARLSRIVGNVSGMTASVSPSGTYVLYSQSTANSFTTELFNTKTGVTTPINLAILPEKCSWLQNENLICAGNSTVASGNYPDDWYAGTTHFFDQLYSISTATDNYTVLYNGQNQSFDMTDLQVDEGQRIVYFIDKNTGLLWQFSY